MLTPALAYPRRSGRGARLRWNSCNPDRTSSGPTSQRWLLDYWASLRGHATVADLARLERRRVRRAVRQSGLDGGRRRGRRRALPDRSFTARSSPKRSAASSASANSSTKSSRRHTCGAALATYRQVVSTKVPVYTVSDMRDPAGRIVHHERLLLPFSLSGGRDRAHPCLDRSRQPRRAVRASRPDEVADPPAGNCALHNDPILECCFPIRLAP